MKWKETIPKTHLHLGQALVFDTPDYLETTSACSTLYEGWWNEWQRNILIQSFFSVLSLPIQEGQQDFFCTSNNILKFHRKPGTIKCLQLTLSEMKTLCTKRALKSQGCKPPDLPCGTQAHLRKVSKWHYLCIYACAAFRLNSKLHCYSSFKQTGTTRRAKPRTVFLAVSGKPSSLKTKAGSAPGDLQCRIPRSKGKNSPRGGSESDCQTSPTCLTRQLFEAVKFNMQPWKSQPGLTPVCSSQPTFKVDGGFTI